MTISMDPSVAPLEAARRYVSWTPVILGALVATALSSILLAFGATIGLGVTSTAPSWRDASAALALLSGLYLIIQAAISFGVGGYIAGRTRSVAVAADSLEIEHSDGVHGLGAWALAVVLGAVLATFLGSATLTRSGSNLPSARTSAAEPLLSYEIDRMFRPNSTPCKRRPFARTGRSRANPSDVFEPLRDEQRGPRISRADGKRNYWFDGPRRRTPGRHGDFQLPNRNSEVAPQLRNTGILSCSGAATGRGSLVGRSQRWWSSSRWRSFTELVANSWYARREFVAE